VVIQVRYEHLEDGVEVTAWANKAYGTNAVGGIIPNQWPEVSTMNTAAPTYRVETRAAAGGQAVRTAITNMRAGDEEVYYLGRTGSKMVDVQTGKNPGIDFDVEDEIWA
jgi:acetyl-CoA acetyltransferase